MAGWPITLKQTVLLVLALLVLTVAGTLIPASWWAVLGLLTTLVVIPLIILFATERRDPG